MNRVSTTPQKSNIDTKKGPYFKPESPAFQGPSFWGPPAVIELGDAQNLEEMYRTPRAMVETLSALGLRHVGYAIPTEMLPGFRMIPAKISSRWWFHPDILFSPRMFGGNDPI